MSWCCVIGIVIAYTLYIGVLVSINIFGNRYFAFEFGLIKMASSSETDGGKKDEKSDSTEKSESKNRLSLERSPYLLQHAANPVHW